ncbi:MAG TPA: hypothetical protein VHQ47_17350 [Phycisphaerae bacterium]|nr:hypothetical protein [Phycisphaerae bacterium]
MKGTKDTKVAIRCDLKIMLWREEFRAIAVRRRRFKAAVSTPNDAKTYIKKKSSFQREASYFSPAPSWSFSPSWLRASV